MDWREAPTPCSGERSYTAELLIGDIHTVVLGVTGILTEEKRLGEGRGGWGSKWSGTLRGRSLVMPGIQELTTFWEVGNKC